MSYIVQDGNLTAAPELRTSQAGRPWVAARVIHNDRERDHDGNWRECSSVPYTVRAYGRTAELLAQASADNGNIRLHFGGRYKVRDFTREDGSEGTAYEVDAEWVAVALGQDVQLHKPGASGVEQAGE